MKNENPENRLVVKLVGGEDTMRAPLLGDLAEFCKSVHDCLKRTERIIAHSPGQIQYRVADLRAASAEVTLQAVPLNGHPEDAPKVLGFFGTTVNRLQSGQAPDPRVSRDDLKVFRKLLRPVLSDPTKQVWVGGQQVTTNYVATIDRLIGETMSSEGEVSGVLEKINVHGKNECNLYPTIGGYSVVCVFPESMRTKVAEALAHKTYVTVTGTVFYRPDRPFPERVHVENLLEHPSDDELPTLQDVRALGPWGTGGLDSLAYLEAIRSDQ